LAGKVIGQLIVRCRGNQTKYPAILFLSLGVDSLTGKAKSSGDD
jgi:hypothetical protein